MLVHELAYKLSTIQIGRACKNPQLTTQRFMKQQETVRNQLSTLKRLWQSLLQQKGGSTGPEHKEMFEGMSTEEKKKIPSENLIPMKKKEPSTMYSKLDPMNGYVS